MVDAVHQIVRLRAMPEAHRAERDEICHVRRVVLVLEPLLLEREQQEPHVDEIAEPEGKGDVPARPELLDVLREKRLVEVFGRMDAQQIAARDGEGAVAREIEEQVKAVRVHVRHRVTQGWSGGNLVHPVLRDEVGHDELVEETREQPMHRAVEIKHKTRARTWPVPMLGEPSPTVYGTRRHGREEHEKSEVPRDRHGADQAVVDADEHVHRAQRGVGKSGEFQQSSRARRADGAGRRRARVDGQRLGQQQRGERQSHGDVPGPFSLRARAVGQQRGCEQVLHEREGRDHPEQPHGFRVFLAEGHAVLHRQHQHGGEQDQTLLEPGRALAAGRAPEDNRQVHVDADEPEINETSVGDHWGRAEWPPAAASSARRRRSALPLAVRGRNRRR